jgi:hypothetical protein
MAASIRIAAALVLAPVVPMLAFAFPFAREGQYFRVLVLTAVVAYGITVVLGLPAFLLLRQTQRGVTLLRVLATSFAIGAVPMAILGVLAPKSSASSPWFEIMGFPAIVGVACGVGGAIFWLIVKPALIVPSGAAE